MVRTVAGPTSEVVASTFDEPSGEHIHVSDIALEKAKRMVEDGRDVVILLDSITRLARAHNTEAPSGRQAAVRRPRLQRHAEAEALLRRRPQHRGGRQSDDPGDGPDRHRVSRMDEVIFEEFKGTGNMELHLDRRLVDKRVWPAIDINRSGTRKEELLMHPDEVGARPRPAPRPGRHAPRRGDGNAGQPAPQDQVERRVPDEHEHVVGGRPKLHESNE